MLRDATPSSNKVFFIIIINSTTNVRERGAMGAKYKHLNKRATLVGCFCECGEIIYKGVSSIRREHIDLKRFLGGKIQRRKSGRIRIRRRSRRRKEE